MAAESTYAPGPDGFADLVTLHPDPNWKPTPALTRTLAALLCQIADRKAQPAPPEPNVAGGGR
jgi:hypothetical protein